MRSSTPENMPISDAHAHDSAKVAPWVSRTFDQIHLVTPPESMVHACCSPSQCRKETWQVSVRHQHVTYTSHRRASLSRGRPGTLPSLPSISPTALPATSEAHAPPLEPSPRSAPQPPSRPEPVAPPTPPPQVHCTDFWQIIIRSSAMSANAAGVCLVHKRPQDPH